MIWHYTVRRDGEREEHTVQASCLWIARARARYSWAGTGWYVDEISFEPDDLNETEHSA